MRTALPTRSPASRTEASLAEAPVKPAILRAAVVAAVANAAVWLAARAGGVVFTVPDFRGGGFTELGLGPVVLSTVLPMLAGGALWTALRRRPHGPAIVRAAAAALTVLSLGGPLGLPVAMGARIALAAMHLVAGTVFVMVVTGTGVAPRRNAAAA